MQPQPQTTQIEPDAGYTNAKLTIARLEAIWRDNSRTNADRRSANELMQAARKGTLNMRTINASPAREEIQRLLRPQPQQTAFAF